MEKLKWLILKVFRQDIEITPDINRVLDKKAMDIDWLSMPESQLKYFKQMVAQLDRLEYQIYKLGQNRKIQFITVNFKPEVLIPEAMSAVNKFSRRKCLKNVVWSYEQRGECLKTLGNGMHVHILTDKVVDITHIKKYAYNSFKKLVGNPKHVDVRQYPYEFRVDKEDYIRGVKWDADKEEKIDMDKIWRKNKGINNFYYNEYKDESCEINQKTSEQNTTQDSKTLQETYAITSSETNDSEDENVDLCRQDNG